MLIIGLTGSIATGKSTVSALLASPPYSLPIIDADLLARQVVEPGTPAYKAIVNYFGPSTPDLLLPPSDGDATSSQPPLNRPALGRRVFGTSEERKRDRMILNKIVHPAVRWEIYKALIICGYGSFALNDSFEKLDRHIPADFKGNDVRVGLVRSNNADSYAPESKRELSVTEDARHAGVRIQPDRLTL